VALPREPFVSSEQDAATPVGFEHVRWVEGDPALAESLRATLRPGPDGVLNALAISGGGANGAFGAGVITEWTRHGGRPQFQVVTGISAGALTAPFAFLGPTWDQKLAQAYFKPEVTALLQPRGPLGLFGLLTPGFYSKRPLERLVESYVSDEVLAAIAAEHKKGRRLLAATTNLDSEQLVIWDLGAIAAHGGAQARKLFRQVLVASASVPMIFPPSLIEVQSGAHAFREMHVDGQAQSAFFAIPQSLMLEKDFQPPPYKIKLFVIINGAAASSFSVTPRAPIPIFVRTTDAANRAAIRSLLIADAEFCHAHGCALYVDALPTEVKDDPLDFSTKHIQAVFDAGKTSIDSGDAWRTEPPRRAGGVLF
jgi:hypothetical protein